MKIKPYKKDFYYSYTLGAFPTIELLKNKKNEVIKVYIHSSFNNKDVLDLIYSLIEKKDIEINDEMINKLSIKENVFIIGVFNKFKSTLDKTKNHLVLDDPSNMGNLGTIIRSSLGFDFKNIAIIKPGVDIFDPKVIRSSMGSIFKINICYFNSLEEYKDIYNKHTIYTFMLQAKNTINEIKFNDSLTSLVFGNEARGLDNKYLDENSIIIKHNNEIDSLNLPTAVGIALYAYQKQK